jgi:O-antigen/teichoic acid export membrane protein
MKALVQVFSFDLASRVVVGIVGIVLIRYMASAEYADYTFALSLVAFLTQSLGATFNRIYVLSSPQGASHAVEWSYLGLQLLLIGGIVLAGLPLLAALGGLYWLIAALAAATCVSEFAKTYHQRDLRFLDFSLIELYRSLLFFCCALLLISFCESCVTAEAVVALQAASLLIIGWWGLEKWRAGWHAGWRAGWITTGAGDMARLARSMVAGPYARLFGYFFVLGFFTQADVFMLKILGSDDMIATYGSALRYYAVLSLALGSVHAVLLPMVRHASSRRELETLLDRHSRMALAFVAAVALAGWAAGWAIPWIDAGKYPDAIVTFRILCVSAVISFAFSPHVNLLMRFERFGFLLALILAALAVHLSISYVLIPAHGAAGAAIATTVAAATVTVSIFVVSRRLIRTSMAMEG